MNKKLAITLGIMGGIIIGALIMFLVLGGNKSKPEEPKETESVIIKFATDGGMKVDDYKIPKGSMGVLPKTTKDGYEFLGWYLNDTEITDTYVFNENITVKAKWEILKEEAKTFKVTYDAKGGTKVNPTTVTCGKTLKLPKNPTRNGYKFVAWEDKNGKTILNGALLSCEDVTLYAKWEQVKVTPTPTSKITPTPEVKITYTCPSGYTLSGSKCIIEATPKEKCPDGTKIDGTLCINTSVSNGGNRVCKEDTVSIDGKGHTWTGKGVYHFYGNSYGKCAYYKWVNYTTKEQCDAIRINDPQNHKTVWVSDLNGCYAEDKMGNYETVCASDYKYYSSSELSSKFNIHDNGKCLKVVSKVKYCDSDYTLSNNKCQKTINATVK